jgi:signal transduction histidine kinase
MLFTTVAYLAAYVALDHLTYFDAIAGLAITPVNPPPGLSLFLLLRFGFRYAPLLPIATFASDVMVRSASPLSWLTWTNAMLIGCGYALVAVMLVRKKGKIAYLRTVSDLNGVVVAATFGPAGVGLAYVLVNVFAGALPTALALKGLLQFWIGDSVGIILTTPALLQLAAYRWRFRVSKPAEAALQLGAVLLAGWVAFGISETDEFKYFYLIFVPIIWVAIRRGLQGAIVANLAVQCSVLAAAGTLTAKGIQIWELQLLILTLALTALYLGVTVSGRWEAERERRVQEVRLNRIQRVASVGELAGSIAHELNQPLSAIAMYVRASMALAGAQQEKMPALDDTLHKADGEVHRASQIIRRLKGLFRSLQAPRERRDLPNLIQGVVASVAQRASDHDIEIQVDCEPNAPQVEVDITQMEIVFRNVLDNAIEALADATDRRRMIRVRVAGTADGSVLCDIADNGPGIPSALQSVLFEPLDSGTRQGMGFGLSISRSIVEAHGGNIESIDNAHGGTTMRVVLPAAQASA